MVSFELCEIHLDKKKFTNVSKEKKKNKKNERMYLREFPGGLVAMARVHAWSGN